MSNRRKLRTRLVGGGLNPWADRPGRAGVPGGDPGQDPAPAAAQPAPPVPLRIPPRGRDWPRGRPRSFQGN